MLALLLLAACKKNSGTNSQGAVNKLKMYIEDDRTLNGHQTDSFAVTYDNDNRITGLVSPNLKFAYAYSAKSFTLDLYENGQFSIHEIAYINSASYVDSTFQFNNTNDTTTEGYTYKGNQLVSKTTYLYSRLGTSIDSRDDYTYDNNGNMTKDVQSDGQGNINMVQTFTYTDKPANVTIHPTYFAQPSKYLPATLKLTDGAGNSLGTVTYSYAFDSSGRLIKETDTADNGDVFVKTYVYY
jgi:YD repeat-containing protein